MGRPASIPRATLHRGSGQAVVRLNGRDFYLGRFGSAKAKAEYDRRIAEWLAGGRQAPGPTAHTRTVAEVILAYWQHAQTHYRMPDGSPGGELGLVRLALRPLKALYGRTAASEFGPLALKAVREQFIKAGQSRPVVNKNVNRIRRVFKWATENELVPPSVFHGLQAVAGLQKGRTSAREPEPIGPVSDAVVEATLAFCGPIVADMVRLQRLTGCRPGEVCILRPCDVNRTGEVWEFKLARHKSEHRGKARVILIGPKAQAILRPYLLRPADSFCFSPSEAEQARLEARHAARKTPMSCGNRPGSNRKPKPRRAPGEVYGVHEYRRALHRAVDMANAETRKRCLEQGREPRDGELLRHWGPNRLRHAAATEIRQRFGLEAAQTVLGHSKADVTQVYAERDLQLARQVALEAG